MARKAKRTDLRGKIVVTVMLRTPENRFFKGNIIRVFSFRQQKVSDIADAIAPVIAKYRESIPAPKPKAKPKKKAA